MALSEFEIKNIELCMENYLFGNRPPVEIREKVDVSYRIERQSVFIFEIRPSFYDSSKSIEEMVAKATYVQSSKVWKIYWQRADLKWYRYPYAPTVREFSEFLDLIEEDGFAYFWG